MKHLGSGNVIQNVLYNIAGSEFRDLVTIALQWKKLIGTLLAERAKVESFQNKTLYVSVNNSVWMQELVLHRKKMIYKIKKQLDIEVADIVFFIKSF